MYSNQNLSKHRGLHYRQGQWIQDDAEVGHLSVQAGLRASAEESCRRQELIRNMTQHSSVIGVMNRIK